MPKKKLTLQEQIEEILKKAEEKGATSNFFFATTFERYVNQIKMMQDLKKEIDEIGVTVKKEYVKGRMNVYTNPAITEYNKTATAANGTVATLIKILDSIPSDGEGKSLKDELYDLLQ